MRKMTWKDGGEEYHLEESEERHIWKIKNSHQQMTGLIAVYVDDFLVTTEAERMKEVFEAIKRTWYCSNQEMVVRGATMRFCGYEIEERQGGGFWLGQEGYLAEMLQRRNVQGTESQPCPRVEEGEEEEPKSLERIKEAQGLVGEAMWLSGRTRPDISFTTGLMSRLLHKRPEYTCKLGNYLLRYLNKTKSARLEYVPDPKQRESKTEEEEVERSLGTVQVFADVSFAPPHEGHKSVQGIMVEHNSNLIFWESVRQSTVSLSTCESELMGYTEGYTAGEGVACLLEVLEFPVRRHLHGDNKAALSVCSQQVGAWRTRHLRIRSSRLREVLQDETSGWKAFHLRGTALPPDGLTKGLQGQAFMANLKERDQPVCLKKVVVNQSGRENPFHKAAAVLAGVGAVLMQQQHCIVGSLVILCSLLCEWRGRTKDRKKNHKTAQEPVKEQGGPTKMDYCGV